ncbi:MAG TPA: hypothetical protein VEJ18_14425 [Planctomycetota bacterium]|nr:hypothetical protein [Planctomycetota bacterium]
MADWKSCDALTRADFERHPLWAFDPSRAEEDPEADDSWVRPFELRETPPESDTLLARATLRAADGQAVPGAVLFAFEKGRAVVGALALLEPSYFAFGVSGGEVPPEDREDLKEVRPGLLPLAYEAVVDAGARPLRLSGAVR